MKPFVRRPTQGRNPRREGASIQGHLSTWLESTVNQTVAESDKRRVSNRALDLYTNDAMGHGLLESLIVEAVGIGLTPQFEPDHAALGLSQDWAEVTAATMNRAWGRWGLDCRNWCDAQRRLNVYGLQQLMYFCWKLDGIGLAQVRHKDGGLRPSRLSVLPIDPSRLVTPSDLSGKAIYDGVEVDDDGAPVKVWIAKPGANIYLNGCPSSACNSFDVWDTKTGLPKILMVTGVRNIAEYRQDSILGPMIEELRNNKDFIGASLVRAMMANLFVLFLENAGVKAETDWANRIVELDKGTLLQGGRQEIPHFFKHEAAPEGYDVMFNSMIDRLGMATSRGAENVSRKYQASYSASKASMVKAQQVNSVDHMTINNNFNQPVAMWLAYEQALAGAIAVPSMATLPQDLYELAQATWMPQPMPEIDRAKRASAIETELATHQTTYADIYGEKSEDWKKRLRQRAVEKKYIKDLEREFEIEMSETKTAHVAPVKRDDQDGSDLETP